MSALPRSATSPACCHGRKRLLACSLPYGNQPSSCSRKRLLQGSMCQNPALTANAFRVYKLSRLPSYSRGSRHSIRALRLRPPSGRPATGSRAQRPTAGGAVRRCGDGHPTALCRVTTEATGSRCAARCRCHQPEASKPGPTSCWRRSTAGSPRALTRPTCKRPRRCWRRSRDGRGARGASAPAGPLPGTTATQDLADPSTLPSLSI